MRLYWSTKFQNKKYDLDNKFTGPDHLRTTTRNNYLPLVYDKQISLTDDFPSGLDCKVVLEDVFSTGLTEKFNVLKSNPDNTHSVSFHRAHGRNFLECMNKKSEYNGQGWMMINHGNILTTPHIICSQVNRLFKIE